LLKSAQFIISCVQFRELRDVMFKVGESFKHHNKVESAVIRNFVIRTKHAMSTDV
jgi:hypothetical protein